MVSVFAIFPIDKFNVYRYNEKMPRGLNHPEAVTYRFRILRVNSIPKKRILILTFSFRTDSNLRIKVDIISSFHSLANLSVLFFIFVASCYKGETDKTARSPWSGDAKEGRSLLIRPATIDFRRWVGGYFSLLSGQIYGLRHEFCELYRKRVEIGRF